MANFVSVIITGNSKPLKTALASATVNMTAFQKKVALGFVVAGAAATAFAASAIKSAIKDQVVMQDLERQIRASTGATKEQIHQSEAYLKAAGRASAFGKTALIPGYKSIILATKDAGKAQLLMNVALDTARARNLDVTAVSEALSKAYAGNTRGLRNLSPEMKKLIADGASFSEVLQILNKNFGGAASGYAKTFQGRMEILKNSTSALKKQIGYALLPVIEKLIPAFQKVADVLLKHPKLITAIAYGIGALSAAFITATVAVTAWKIATQAAALMNAALGASFTALQVSMGVVTIALGVAFLAYKFLSGSKEEATIRTNELTDAILMEKSAQSGALAELVKNNEGYARQIESLKLLGLSFNDVTTYVNTGKGNFTKYVDALKVFDSTTGTTIRKLDAFAKAAGFDPRKRSASQIYEIASALKALATNAQTAKGEVDSTKAALALLAGVGVTTAEQDTAASAAASAAQTRFASFKKTVADTKKAIAAYVQSISDSISGTISLSTALSEAQSNSDTYTQAIKDRTKAYEDLNKAQRDQDPDAYSAALMRVAEAEKAATDAQGKTQNYAEAFKTQISQAKEFAALIGQLAKAKLGKAGLAQILSLGPVAGAAVAKDILSGTNGLSVSSLNADLAGVAAAGTAAGMSIPGYAAAATAQASNKGNTYHITVQAGIGDKTEIGKQVVEVLQAYEKRLGKIPIKVS
jgi:hypothetical protein